ncbi:MAG: hypothetical protein ACJ8R9_21945 [Steroidobacteraceae bacterium]
MIAAIDVEAIDEPIHRPQISPVSAQGMCFEPAFDHQYVPLRACDRPSVAAGAYVSGALTPEQTYEFELHFLNCEECLNRIEAHRAALATLRRSRHQDADGWAMRPEPTTTTKASTDLVAAFTRVENILRSSGIPRADRYVIVLQLLVLRLSTEEELDGIVADVLLRSVSLTEQGHILERMLSVAMARYRKFLPVTVTAKCACSGYTIARLWQQMFGVSVLRSSFEALQQLLTKFRVHPVATIDVRHMSTALEPLAAATEADVVHFHLLIHGVSHAGSIRSHALTLFPLSKVGVGS